MNQLEQAVLAGLSSPQKYIPSSFFYDEKGSEIYQKITSCQDYYLIRCEIEALENNKSEIVQNCKKGNNSMELVDLGAGDAMKTSILIDAFLKEKVDLTYVPVDISHKFIKDALERFKKINLNVRPVIGCYFDVLPKLKSKTQKLLCFLGSNIGNFTEEQEVHFLKEIRKVMNPDDKLLLGCDLIKDPKDILQAYNDSEGHTSAFNLNMLERLNREFGANIEIDNFVHYPIFDPLEPGAKSFLVSKIDQVIHLEKYNKSINFHKWEHIHTETSRKYTSEGLHRLAEKAGLQINQQFFCSQEGYVLAFMAPV